MIISGAIRFPVTRCSADMAGTRAFAVKLLTKMDKSSAYSNLLLDDALSRSAFDDREKRFVSALFYGTLERRYTLDAVITAHLRNPMDKLSGEVLSILRTGLYQLLYMDSVPDNAAVDESVKLAKHLRNPALAGFVNGLLRSFIREGKKLPEFKNHTEKLSVEFSSPLWLTEKWISEYGEKTALAMLSSSLGRAPVTVKANTLKMPLKEIIRQLEEDGFAVSAVDTVRDALEVSGGSIEKSRAYKAGLVHVQDISCMLCCEALAPQENDTVIDICSAPGGKAFTSAELMSNKGRILAFDLHKNRVSLIRNGAERLGLTIIEADVNDGKSFNPDFPLADKVLCDVPCSGLGVIRRKPEIKFKSPDEFVRLPEIQYDILSVSSRYVKTGGRIVYSTCTLSRAENDEVADRFLREHPDFTEGKLPEVLGEGHKVTITPERFGSDGFFIAVFIRKR